MSDPPPAERSGGFAELPLEELRRRRSIKWTLYPADVLPAFVAELDFALAPPVAAALGEAVALGDTGYPGTAPLEAAFARFARERFGWDVDPSQVRQAPDVMTAVAELLRALTAAGDGVVVNPPIYPPFRSVTAEVGRRVVEAPLAHTAAGFELDLDALERCFAAGARAYLLCNPHNPSGRSFRRAELEGVAELAARYGVAVVADEIHAPMTLAGATHVPYVALGDEAALHGVVVTGASKAWNVAGLRCALVVSASAEMEARLETSLSRHLAYHVGHFGALAATAAFEHGTAWLDELVATLERNRAALAALLEAELPEVGYVPPEAGYLAWLDFRSLGLGDDPAAVLLERGRVALSSGPSFGTQGNGFARLNFGTSEAILAECARRVAAGAHAPIAQSLS